MPPCSNFWLNCDHLEYLSCVRFKKLLQSIAVDGEDMLAAAREANWKSVARLDARDAAAKAKAKREEERIAELRRVRGERWLPSIAREMQVYISNVRTQKFQVYLMSKSNILWAFTKLSYLISFRTSLSVHLTEIRCNKNR